MKKDKQSTDKGYSPADVWRYKGSLNFLHRSWMPEHWVFQKSPSEHSQARYA